MSSSLNVARRWDVARWGPRTLLSNGLESKQRQDTPAERLVCLWHLCDVDRCLLYGRLQAQTGHQADIAEGPGLTHSSQVRLRLFAAQN